MEFFSLVCSWQMVRLLGLISYAFKTNEALHIRLIMLTWFCKLYWSEPNGQQKAPFVGSVSTVTSREFSGLSIVNCVASKALEAPWQMRCEI